MPAFGTGNEKDIKADILSHFVGGYEPTTFNFHGLTENVKPSDFAVGIAVIMPNNE